MLETKTDWRLVADAQDIPVREGRRILTAGYEIALFNVGDGYLAVDNRCPHRQGPLADGIVSGKSVFCPLHNWKISLESGCALSGGEGRVKKYPARVENGQIWVDFKGAAES